MTTDLDPQTEQCPNCGCVAITRQHFASNTAACPYWVPSKGWVLYKDLTADDRAEMKAWEPAKTLRYDPNHDQCGKPPFHGTRRAGIIWNGEPVFMCPKCFNAILGAPPLPHQRVKVPKALWAPSS